MFPVKSVTPFQFVLSPFVEVLLQVKTFGAPFVASAPVLAPWVHIGFNKEEYETVTGLDNNLNPTNVFKVLEFVNSNAVVSKGSNVSASAVDPNIFQLLDKSFNRIRKSFLVSA